MSFKTGPRSAICNMPDCRYQSDCRSKDREFDPGRVPITFVEIDHEIISTAILLISYKQKYVHEVLVNG